MDITGQEKEKTMGSTSISTSMSDQVSTTLSEDTEFNGTLTFGKTLKIVSLRFLR